jgi:hypothetical protein
MQISGSSMTATKLRFSLSLAACALAMLLIVSPAHANTLAPGELGSPDVFSSLSGLTLLASYSGSESGGGDTWDLAEAVYSTSGGDLDFMFQVTNTTAGGTTQASTNLDFRISPATPPMLAIRPAAPACPAVFS